MNDIENKPEKTGFNSIDQIIDQCQTLKEFQKLTEKMFLSKKLKDNSFNILKTANNIEIQRSLVYNKIESLEIVIPGRINRAAK